MMLFIALGEFALLAAARIFSRFAPAIPSVVSRAVRPGEQTLRLASSTEQGVSVFNAGVVKSSEITSSLKGEVRTITSKMIEKHGMILEKTPGAAIHPKVLRENHWEIRPGKGMNKKQFTKALKELSKAINGGPSR